MQALLQAVKTRIPDVKGEEQDSLLLALLSDADMLIKNYTGRESVPEQLRGAQVRLAVMLFNRLGTEGEKSRTEGDIQRSFDALLQGMRHELLPFRVVKTGSA